MLKDLPYILREMQDGGSLAWLLLRPFAAFLPGLVLQTPFDHPSVLSNINFIELLASLMGQAVGKWVVSGGWVLRHYPFTLKHDLDNLGIFSHLKQGDISDRGRA